MALANYKSLWRYIMCFGAGGGLGYSLKNSLLVTDVLPEKPPIAASVVHKNSCDKNIPLTYDFAINQSRDIVLRVKEELGIPGLCIAVSVDGRTVWTEGFGFADVENGVPCSPNTVMRIASISKSITMAALAKLWEDGKVDLDQPVQEYVPGFPRKLFNGEPVEITTRMLTSHLSGIRHWKEGKENNKVTDPSVTQLDNEKEEVEEMHLNKNFRTTESALSIFKDDDLVHKPGTKYLYSSPAWTLVSAVMEKAAGKTFDKIMDELFLDLGLFSTRLDKNDPITIGRSRYYIRDKSGRLVNAPCVNNSCKWAGGGLQSTVIDLTKFANAMLYCLQQCNNPKFPGYLQKKTIEALWTVTPFTKSTSSIGYGGYGMGWVVVPKQDRYGGVSGRSFMVAHTGGAVGASSILLIEPSDSHSGHIPSGITVAIIVNLQNVGLSKLATLVSEKFSQSNISLNE